MDREAREYYADILNEIETAPALEQQFIDIDISAPPPVQLPAEPWVDYLSDTKDEFEVDDAIAVFSTFRVEVDDPRRGGMVLDTRLIDVRVGQLIRGLPEGRHILRIKFLREGEDGKWVIEENFNPVKTER